MKKQQSGYLPDERDSSRPKDWSAYFAEHPIASKEFMEGVEDLPAEKRSFFAASRKPRARLSPPGSGAGGRGR